eukprot:gene43210-57502_t
MGNDQSSNTNANAATTAANGAQSRGIQNSSSQSNITNINVANAPPGAYKMPGQPRNQRFYVTIPRGVRPGQHFAVLVNGQQMMVRCPEGNRQGDRLIVTAPRQNSQQYVVTVPEN